MTPDGPAQPRPPRGAAAARGAERRPAPARLTDERPQAPWHPIPLVELSVFIGLVLIVVGFVVGIGSDGGRLALLCGLVLASLGGLDTVLREHFAGFRSHSSVLAGLPAVLVAGGAVLRPGAVGGRRGGRRDHVRRHILVVPAGVPPPVGWTVVPLK